MEFGVTGIIFKDVPNILGVPASRALYSISWISRSGLYLEVELGVW